MLAIIRICNFKQFVVIEAIIQRIVHFFYFVTILRKWTQIRLFFRDSKDFIPNSIRSKTDIDRNVSRNVPINLCITDQIERQIEQCMDWPDWTRWIYWPDWT